MEYVNTGTLKYGIYAGVMIYAWDYFGIASKLNDNFFKTLGTVGSFNISTIANAVIEGMAVYAGTSFIASMGVLDSII